jgi:hypothetical protein
VARPVAHLQLEAAQVVAQLEAASRVPVVEQALPERARPERARRMMPALHLQRAAVRLAQLAQLAQPETQVRAEAQPVQAVAVEPLRLRRSPSSTRSS